MKQARGYRGNLLAAAPDLLAALKHAQRYLQSQPIRDALEYGALRERMKDAIKKAEGE